MRLALEALFFLFLNALAVFPSIFDLWNIYEMAAFALMESLLLRKFLAYFYLLLIYFGRDKQGMLVLRPVTLLQI